MSYEHGDEYTREIERRTAQNTADALEKLSEEFPAIEWGVYWGSGSCNVAAEAVPDEGTIHTGYCEFHVGATIAQVYRLAREAAQHAMKLMAEDRAE